MLNSNDLNAVSNHPKFQEIQGLGMVDDAVNRQTMLVYLDLSESKGWWNLALKPCCKLKTILITGYETQNDAQSVVIPVRSDAQLSMEDIDLYKTNVKEAMGSDSFLLALIASDSTIVYYKVSQGLVLPERPEELEAKKQKRFRYRERRKQRRMKYAHIADAMELKSKIKKTQQTATEMEITTDSPRLDSLNQKDVTSKTTSLFEQNTFNVQSQVENQQTSGSSQIKHQLGDKSAYTGLSNDICDQINSTSPPSNCVTEEKISSCDDYVKWRNSVTGNDKSHSGNNKYFDQNKFDNSKSDITYVPEDSAGTSKNTMMAASTEATKSAAFELKGYGYCPENESKDTCNRSKAATSEEVSTCNVSDTAGNVKAANNVNCGIVVIESKQISKNNSEKCSDVKNDKIATAGYGDLPNELINRTDTVQHPAEVLNNEAEENNAVGECNVIGLESPETPIDIQNNANSELFDVSRENSDEDTHPVTAPDWIPSMAPEDFEDAEYEQEFEGEL